MTIKFTVADVVPATPDEVYDTWLDTDGHSKMTGSPTHASADVGGKFDAWDGYISGENLELEQGRRIVQSWRAASYKDSDGDSQIEVIFEAVEGGTKVTLTHTNVPDDQGSHESGWSTHYFEPMKVHFRKGT
jgi:activator of HSP90 ATPase